MSTPIPLPAVLEIASAESLRQVLIEAIADAVTADLDAGAVTQVDTAALQVLCAFANDARALGLDPRLVRPSPAMREAVEALALSAHLGLEAA